MLSTVSRSSLRQNRLKKPAPHRNSINNIQLSPNFHRQLKNVAVQRIAADILKSLMASKRSEFVEARNKVEIPFGMFGLSLNKFYERRKENTVYIGVLEMVCKTTLERAKFCVVLDDLHDYIHRLFIGYHNNIMKPILREIGDSLKLITINETILDSFKKNSVKLAKLHDKLNVFNVRETNAIAAINNQVYTVQNNCVEAELVLDPIEFRYKMSFHNGIVDQSIHKIQEVEDQLQATLTKLEMQSHRESVISDSIRMKQRMDIDMLKTKLDQMTKKYDQDYEALDGSISYKVNGMEAMHNQHVDSLAKLDFFAVEVVALREWLEEWKIKMREEERLQNVAKKKGKK